MNDLAQVHAHRLVQHFGVDLSENAMAGVESASAQSVALKLSPEKVCVKNNESHERELNAPSTSDAHLNIHEYQKDKVRKRVQNKSSQELAYVRVPFALDAFVYDAKIKRFLQKCQSC